MTDDEFRDWRDQDGVVLKAVYEAEQENLHLGADHFPDFDPGQFNVALQRLRDDDLIAGRFAPDSDFIRGAMPLGGLRVTPKGLRVLRQWPREWDADGLVRALENFAADQPDEVKKNKARRAAEALREFTLEFGARTTAEIVLRMESR